MDYDTRFANYLAQRGPTGRITSRQARRIRKQLNREQLGGKDAHVHAVDADGNTLRCPKCRPMPRPQVATVPQRLIFRKPQ